MITKIELTNFKSHAHTVIEPGRVTALVGPNGCGKSSILQALQLLCDSISLRDRNGEIPLSQLMRANQTTFSTKIDGCSEICSEDATVYPHEGTSKKNWRIALETSSSTTLLEGTQVPEWGLVLRWQCGIEEGVSADSSSSFVKPGHGLPSFFSKVLQPTIYFKATANNLATPSYPEEIPPRISSDGKGLASTIANLMTTETDWHQAIVASLSKLVPQVKNVRVKPTKVYRLEQRVISIDEKKFPVDEQREVIGHEIIFDIQTARGLPANSMSDGTLLVLGLLTLLWSSPSAHLILLDDIESGLHPLAQRQLMQVLKDFAEKHDRQIILTSHSPYIIDELDAKDVWVMATDKEGISHAKRLSDHPDAERALSVLTTGEFASAYDEEWVVNENKPVELVNG